MTLAPYYDHAGITIYHGDCLEILPQLGPVDAVVTDPPYGLSIDITGRKCGNKSPPRQAASWDVDRPNLTPMLGLGKPAIVWGGSQLSDLLPRGKCWLCWVKTARNGSNVRQCEMDLAWTNYLGRGRVFRHLWIGCYRASESGQRNVHPTQKPIAVMAWCINLLPPGCDLILDPFMGSGTTLRAAKDLGRKAIGIEIEERYCEIAAKRLAQEVLPL